MYYDLLLHVDSDEDSLKTALRNAVNYNNAGIREAYSIAIVVNGKAVALFRRETCQHVETINKLLGDHTTIYICNNALTERNIDASALIDGLTIVPAGIVHLVKLQREGFAYVKP
jgi:uncharacterized protein